MGTHIPNSRVPVYPMIDHTGTHISKTRLIERVSLTAHLSGKKVSVIFTHKVRL